MLAWWIAIRLGTFRPGPFGLVLSGLALGFFYVQHVLRLGLLPIVVLPLVLIVGLVPLWRHRNHHLHPIDEPRLAVERLACLLIAPLVATVVYQLAGSLALDRVPISTIVYYWITAPLGTLMFLIAVVKCARRGSRHLQRRDGPG